MKDIKTIWEKYYIHSLIFSIIFSLLYIFWFQSSFFYSSILEYKWISSDEFDGSVYPIEYVPNPIKLTYEQRRQKFDEIDSKYFIKIPVYNPNIFWKDLDSLSVSSQDYSEAMTQKVVYTVPYLSTYNFDYKEYSGSHPWIDIVVPEWTPVLNIANWVVVQTWFQSAGFWNYVLIKHSNILFSSKTQTIYSLYAHLSKIDVLKWTKIKKWQQIGLVWQTWTATVPHLHFQIDVDSAPYSPFWPFTTADMKSAWVWFFEAVNIGLWKEQALLHTINPLKFVNDNLSFVLYAWWNQDIKKEEIINIEPKVETPIIEDTPIVEIPDLNSAQEIDEIVVSNPEYDIIKQEELDFNEDFSLNQVVKKEDVLKIDVELLSSIDPDIVLNDNKDLKDIWNETQETLSGTEILKEILNEIEDSQIIIENINSKLFVDIKDDYKYFNELKYFKENNIISWFLDKTFRPNNNITRIEALKIMLLANNISPIKDLESVFSDIKTNTWENTYVNAWIENKVVSLDNKRFYPFRNVSRVEALKIILTLWEIDLENQEFNISFEDVSELDWFYKYVNYAVNNNLFENIWEKFEPNKPLTREEMIYILYKYMNK